FTRGGATLDQPTRQGIKWYRASLVIRYSGSRRLLCRQGVFQRVTVPDSSSGQNSPTLVQGDPYLAGKQVGIYLLCRVVYDPADGHDGGLLRCALQYSAAQQRGHERICGDRPVLDVNLVCAHYRFRPRRVYIFSASTPCEDESGQGESCQRKWLFKSRFHNQYI